jgi:hypothetical protein
MNDESLCSSCQGDGYGDDPRCTACRGSGQHCVPPHEEGTIQHARHGHVEVTYRHVEGFGIRGIATLSPKPGLTFDFVFDPDDIESIAEAMNGVQSRAYRHGLDNGKRLPRRARGRPSKAS